MNHGTEATGDEGFLRRNATSGACARLLRLLVDAQRVLLRASQESVLLDELCRLMVTSGVARAACIGLRDALRGGVHQPVTCAGADGGVDPSLLARAIGAGQTVTLPNELSASGAPPALCGATIAVPLRADGLVLGALAVQLSAADSCPPECLPLLGELADELAHTLGTLRVRAASRRATDSLRESHWQLEASQRLGHLGSWHRDMDANEIRMTAEAYRIFGLAPVSGAWSLADWHLQWSRLIHPGDRAHVARALDDALSDRAPYDVEYRVIRPDGEVRYVHSLAEVERDPTGRPRRIMGTMHDVTERKRAEESARTAERQLVTLMDSFPDGVSRFDAAGRFLYASPSIARTLVGRNGDLIGRTPRDLGLCESPDGDDALMASIMRVAATGGTERLEVRMRMPHGVRDVEVRHVAEHDAEGGIVSVLGIATDLTERKSAARQLYLLNYALDHVRDTIYLMEGDAPLFTYANQSAADLLGYTRDELTGGMGILDIDPAWTAERWYELLPALRVVRQVTFETTQRTRSGRDVQVEVTSNSFEFEGQHYIMVIARDISERRAAEAALRTREQQLRTLVDNTPDLLVRWDRSLRRTFVNHALADSLGHPADTLLGRPFGESHRPEMAAVLADIDRQIRRTFLDGEPQSLEHTFHATHGPRTVQLRLVAERDDAGDVVSVLGIGRDITALKETERQLRSLVEHSPDIILRLDTEGRYLFANSTVERVTGVPVTRLIGKVIGSVTGRGTAEQYRQMRDAIEALQRTGRPVELEVTLPLPPGTRDFDVRLVPEAEDDGSVRTLMAVVRDITVQKRTEAELRASEQRFRQVTETIDEVFWLVDASTLDGVYISPAYARVFGRSCESFYADPRSWQAAVHPDDLPRVQAALATQASASYDIEYRILRDGEVAWIRDRAFPIRDTDGRTYRIAGVAEDITVRRRLEDRLRQAQKMEAVGQLAGGIAHDFNNILAIIQLQSTLLLQDNADARTARDGLKEILAVTERAANLTRQLLTFSRQQVTRLEPLDLGEVLGRTTRLLRRVLGADISLTTRFASALPLVEADGGMMEQVLMNLAINARDAMPDGGRLLIAVEAVHVGAEQAAQHPTCAPGPYVCVAVTDTGEGIAADVLPRIFDPFFTTKDVGKGTGLGLATVFGIMQQHRGWIDVESTPGSGSTFRAYLPAHRARGHTPQATLVPEEVRGGNETILLVEDEATLRAVSRTTLERHGYRVLVAESAAEALTIWAGEQGRIDLLLTDLVMPGGRTGRQLAGELLARAPTLRVLYSTGYSPDVVDRLLDLDAGRRLLQKPYSATTLARAVRRCLDDVAG